MNNHIKDQPALPVIHIGVTGHREHRINKHIAKKFSIFINYVLNIIFTFFSNSQSQYHHSFNNKQIYMVSALAEGADRIFAKEGLRNKLNLCCIIPFSRKEYKKDFQRKDSKDEYERFLFKSFNIVELGYKRYESDGYEAIGRKIVDICDLMIALWDGEPARGPGGTAHVIEIALSEGKPVLWFPLDHKQKVCFLMPIHNIKRVNYNDLQQRKWAKHFKEWLKIKKG